MSQAEIQKDLSFYVVCDNIRSLENIGSIFRTSDALEVDKIFLGGICGKPPQSKISKTALGAEETVIWEHQWQVWRAVEKLKQEGVSIVALEQTENSVVYTDFKPTFPLVLIIGNEIKGVSSGLLKRADHVIHLPMFGQKKSLNVAVAFGVTAYYLNRMRLL